jgi:hypothetical protein
MIRKYWRWIVFAALAPAVIATFVSAFAVPWRGTTDQWMAIGFAACLLFVFTSFAALWFRGGFGAIRNHFALLDVRTQTLWSDKKRLVSETSIWIIIALVLVAILNMTQSR